MRILQNKKSGHIVEITTNEMRSIMGKTFYSDDYNKFCNNDTELNIGKWAKAFSNSELFQIENSIKSLNSAVEFLNNKKESIEYASNLKENNE